MLSHHGVTQFLCYYCTQVPKRELYFYKQRCAKSEDPDVHFGNARGAVRLNENVDAPLKPIRPSDCIQIAPFILLHPPSLCC